MKNIKRSNDTLLTDTLAYGYFVPLSGGGECSYLRGPGWLLKAMVVQVFRKYGIGLHPKNDGASTYPLVTFQLCYRGLIADFMVERCISEHYIHDIF